MPGLFVGPWHLLPPPSPRRVFPPRDTVGAAASLVDREAVRSRWFRGVSVYRHRPYELAEGLGVYPTALLKDFRDKYLYPVFVYSEGPDRVECEHGQLGDALHPLQVEVIRTVMVEVARRVDVRIAWLEPLAVRCSWPGQEV